MIDFVVLPLLLASALAAGGGDLPGSIGCLREMPNESRPMAQWRLPGAQPVPARGKLLVARPGMMDPNFAESVVLLLRYDESGAMGLIVNRPSGMTLAQLLPKMEGLNGREDPLYLGGPVNPENLLLLVRSAEQPDLAIPVVDDVFVSESPELLEKLLESEGNHEFRAFAGYAGWGPSQLEMEIERGDWHIAPGTGARVFSTRPGELWRALQPRNELEWSRLDPRAGAREVGARPRLGFGAAAP